MVIFALLILLTSLFSMHALAQNQTATRAIPLVTNLYPHTDLNQKLNITLTPEDRNYSYSIKTLPSQGKIAGLEKPGVIDFRPVVTYIPKPNFTGTDDFTYKVNNESALVLITVGKVVVPHSTTMGSMILAFIIAIIVILFITLSSRTIIRKIKSSTIGSVKSSTLRSTFSDIIRGYDMDPSLSVFQFLLWTFGLMFAFIGVYLIRIFAGVSDTPQGPLPVYLLSIAGISVASPIVSSLISSFRYNSVQFYEGDKPPIQLSEPQINDKEGLLQTRSKPSLGEMLRENGKPTLSRFQMFAWTWIGIGIYLVVLFSKVLEMSQSVQSLSVPDVDPTLVVLMGLSQVAFLGLKTTGSTELQISKIYPLERKPGNSLVYSEKTLDKHNRLSG